MLVAVVVLAAAILALALVMLRVFRNVGPLSLEEHARRNGVVYLPIGKAMAEELQTWSKPLRMRVERDHELIGQLILTTKLQDEEPASIADELLGR